ncbi:hypothetical protein KC343_g2588 [Hortaea werneckii]|uniref:Spindle pole body component n=1 Tax=Hortaea werneckii TaxID=91943 RepID=A0A3M7GWM5_HORWE|nr:hypothetical protein KC352_g21816 [Hortaea werneckii]KAI7569961.1 hypothetical protein KC317_g2881 [Hortaea werneckii]KAI7623935.1 hypothetical protein KC346_g2462 [Hortaea werneckii]KAI7634068.1 hypothetical protein KC343_g2588 [Hortaea werneckii]KAI7715913.1 hypothetical protein KC322_g2800 [Hortaea werneckii]
MDTPISHGFAFDLSSLWQCPEPSRDFPSDTLFQKPDFEVPPLENQATETADNYLSGFSLPPLGDGESLDIHENPDDALDHLEPLPDFQPDIVENDAVNVWNLESEVSQEDSVPKLRTWEAFERRQSLGERRVCYLSEAGPQAFDAALNSARGGAASQVLPQNTAISALYNLALGRASVFFQWSDDKTCFYPTLQEYPISGHSQQLTSSIMAQTIAYGSMVRRLRSFADPAAQVKGTLPALMALKLSVSNILETLEGELIRRFATTRSILQLQGILERPRQLLHVLCALRDLVDSSISEEQAISELSDYIHSAAEAGSVFSGLLRDLLNAVREPWLTRLSCELGLTAKSFTEVESGGSPDDVNEDLEASLAEDDQSMDAPKALLTADDRSLVKETRATLKVLSRYLSPSKLLAAAETAPVENGNPGQWRMHTASTESASSYPTTEQEQLDHLQKLDALIDTEPRAVDISCNTPLMTSTLATVRSFDLPGIFETQAAEEWNVSLNPFDALRPRIEAQSLRLNKMVLDYLFQHCKLRAHLELQCAFHLFRNGTFVTRLSTALFSEETQSAERRQGALPSSETMGLRLGTRDGQRWPPASSELRLTLLGILNEAYYGASADDVLSHGKQADLPGGLSFSIRELPDEEIDRVMDAGSLYALDFLRLQYVPPAPLDTIITSGSLQRYDDIFRFLLRLLRLLHTTTQMKRDKAGRSVAGAIGSIHRAAFAAHHFVSGLLSYFLDIGIAAPWQTLQQQLDGVERGIDTEEGASVGINGLRNMHNVCLDSIRGRLFLKRKQGRTKQLIENLLSAILGVAQATGTDTGKEAVVRAQKSFDQAAAALIAEMKAIATKPPKLHDRSSESPDEADMAKLLLSRLDWNGYSEPMAS